MCQKIVSTHTSQFRSKISLYSEINPNHDCFLQTNVRMDLPSLRRRRIKSPFYPLNKDYKYLHLLRRRHFSCSTFLPLFFFKNTSTSPPFSGSQAKHFLVLRTSSIDIQESFAPTMVSISEIPEVRPFSTSLFIYYHSSFLCSSFSLTFRISLLPPFFPLPPRILGTM